MFVDDESNVLTSLRWLFSGEPYEFYGFDKPQLALNALKNDRFAVVVADHRMPQMTGTEFLEKVRKDHPDIIRIITTGYADMEVTVNAINQSNVYRFLFKPWEKAELKQTIKNAVAHYKLLRKNRKLVQQMKARNKELRAMNNQLEEMVNVRSDKIIQEEAEKRALETKLVKLQKMEALGTLAGGIAHDFNNILSAIIGYTELAKMSVSEDDQIFEYLQRLEKAELRAKKLVNQILSFSKHKTTDKVPLMLHDILDEALKMLRSILPTTISIRQSIAQCSSVMGRETQLHQVVMNLCTNAYQAMEKEGGTLRIGLSETTIEDTDRALDPALPPGRYVQLTVEDTGPGISPHDLEKIFDPYYTTKPSGKGTGLGLSMAHSIVKQLGGDIRVRSREGKGSRFSVFLPAKEGTSRSRVEKQDYVNGGSERLLFIDDEPTLAEIGRETLHNLGYDVVALTDSRAALELFRANPNRFDLVITDMTMPVMTGEILAKNLMAIRSDIPVIICTGFSERISAEKAKAMGIKAFALKPLVTVDLARTIRGVLDVSGEAAASPTHL